MCFRMVECINHCEGGTTDDAGVVAEYCFLTAVAAQHSVDTGDKVGHNLGQQRHSDNLQHFVNRSFCERKPFGGVTVKAVYLFLYGFGLFADAQSLWHSPAHLGLKLGVEAAQFIL